LVWADRRRSNLPQPDLAAPLNRMGMFCTLTGERQWFKLDLVLANYQNPLIGAAMREALQPAIEALQQRLIEQERKIIETKTLINRLCEEMNVPPMYPNVGEPSRASVTALRADTFYGKSVTTAAREFLEMRRAA